MEDNFQNSLEFLNTKQKHDQDKLSTDDLAWADSCLIADPEISEANMDSLKEALLHILDQHSNEEGKSNDENVPDKPTPQPAKKSIDQDVDQETHDVLSILKKQPFLPNFTDEMMNNQYSDDDDTGFVLSEFVAEPQSDEGIFKVWDLDIPDEEDELGKQLKEALSVKTESIDSLVESIADLSIK